MHLDKGHFGGPWKAVVPMRSVKERIVEEQGFLESWLPETPKKAQALIDLITGFGVTHMKVQVNVDPVIGLKNYKIVKEVLDENSDELSYEMIAFPQHGTLETQKENLLEEALKEGIEYLGGLDPANIDNDIEESLRVSFDLAKKYERGLDFHLHTAGTLGIYEIERILEYTKKYGMEDKVSISHGLSLGDIAKAQVDALSKRFVELGVDINTTQPVGRKALPFMDFINNGVSVNVVNDNINDHWSSFGSGDIIEKLNIGCQIHGYGSEYAISRTLKAATGGITPLSDDGNIIWPKVGDRADILFVKAESSAHLIARLVKERVVFFKGKFLQEFK